MPLLRSLIVLVGPLLVFVRCNFFASLQSSFVVNLDFASSRNDGSEEETKLIAFGRGQRLFSCQLPGPKGNSSAMRSSLRDAKMIGLRGPCLTASTGDNSTVTVCSGKKVLLSYGLEEQASLGEHMPMLDELAKDGSVTEWYTGGMENRSAAVRYVCGRFSAKNVTVAQDGELHYVVKVPHPAFCPWRGSMARTRDGETLHVSALMEHLKECVNLTQSWWSFEYCFPNTMLQFHAGPDGQRETQHLLGTADETGNFSLVRRTHVRPGDTSPHLAIQQKLSDGAVCDETGRPRSVTVSFQCPRDWRSAPPSQIASVTEPAMCEYNVVVHSALLCAHPDLLPAMRATEEISCLAQ